VAAEIIDACRDLKVTVPDEIAVLGVGNDESLCEAVAVPLSSVELDIEQMAYRAAATLDAIMRGDPAPDLMRVRPKGVITRISTDISAVSNPHVAQALNYIAEHYPEPVLCVADVAEAVGVSRRHLERSFRTETGCTIYEHIVKRRMQEASRLLRTHPRAKIAAIAELVGLDGAGNFFRTFRRFFGESPKVHREGAGGTTIASDS
jgi:LacI family transcriptional regulator